MDKLTKFIPIYVLAVLAVVIFMMIGNRLLLKKIEIEPVTPAEPPTVSKILKQAEEKNEKLESIIEESKQRQEEKPKANKERIVGGLYIPPEERVSPFPDADMECPHKRELHPGELPDHHHEEVRPFSRTRIGH